jgi:cytochrome c553
MSRRSSITLNTSSFDITPQIPFLRYPSGPGEPAAPPDPTGKVPGAMLKVLTVALLGTIVGVVLMIAVIALAGTDTEGSSSVGLGSLPLSTFSPSTPATSAPPPASGGSTGGGTSSPASGDPAKGEQLFAANCASCHAVQPGAASPFSGAPNLADLNASGALTEQKILDQIANAAPPMPAGLVSGQDAKDVAAYILTLGK